MVLDMVLDMVVVEWWRWKGKGEEDGERREGEGGLEEYPNARSRLSLPRLLSSGASGVLHQR
jgi:hypothetical protein